MASQTMVAWTEFPVLSKIPWKAVSHPEYEASHLHFHTHHKPEGGTRPWTLIQKTKYARSYTSFQC